MYDLTIVGAGPAGATLARLLGKTYKILLLDRRKLDQPTELGMKDGLEKCCGGLIAPDAQHTLARMGLGVPREVLVGPQLFSVRTIDVKNRLERYYQRHYINIDREKFDSWLVSLVPPQVNKVFGSSLKRFEPMGEGIKLRYTVNRQEVEVETRFLVGADGAASTVRRALQPNHEIQKYFSIQEWFRVDNNTPYYTALFDPDITDFYSWTIPKEEYLIIGSALLPEQNPPELFELLKKKLIAYGLPLGESVKRNGAYILRPKNSSQILLGKGRIALIGEAAGWISPTSAEGLSYAFKSALALAESFQGNFEKVLENYAKHTQSLKMNIWMKNRKSPGMYNNFLRKTVLKTGILSMDMIKQ